MSSVEIFRIQSTSILRMTKAFAAKFGNRISGVLQSVFLLSYVDEKAN
jgi:hypothetical protein